MTKGNAMRSNAVISPSVECATAPTAGLIYITVSTPKSVAH